VHLDSAAAPRTSFVETAMARPHLQGAAGDAVRAYHRVATVDEVASRVRSGLDAQADGGPTAARRGRHPTEHAVRPNPLSHAR